MFDFSTPPEKPTLQKIWEYLHLLFLVTLPVVVFFADRFPAIALIATALSTCIWRYSVNARPLVPLPSVTLLFKLMIVLLVWLALSSIWSIDPLGSIERWFRLVVLIGAGLFCALAMEARIENDIFWPLLVACFIAVVLALLRTIGVPVAEVLGLDVFMDVSRPQNRSVMILTVISGLIWVKTIAPKPSTNMWRYGCAWLLWLCVLAVTLLTPGLSPIAFWMVLTVVFLAMQIFSRLVWVAALVSMILIMTLFPVAAHWITEGFYFFGGPPAWLGSEFSGDGRTEIWKRTVEQIMANPLIGYGLGTENLTEVDSHHPHNAWLQVALNCGLIGLALMASLIVKWMFNLTKLPARDFPVYTALTVALFVVATISHGAWQSWWLATIAIVLNPKLRIGSDPV